MRKLIKFLVRPAATACECTYGNYSTYGVPSADCRVRWWWGIHQRLILFAFANVHYYYYYCRRACINIGVWELWLCECVCSTFTFHFIRAFTVNVFEWMHELKLKMHHTHRAFYGERCGRFSGRSIQINWKHIFSAFSAKKFAPLIRRCSMRWYAHAQAHRFHTVPSVRWLFARISFFKLKKMCIPYLG